MCGPLQDCNYSLPIPTYSLIEFVQSKNWTQIFSKQDSDYPWDSKIPQAVWRGSNNGHWRSIMLNITKALNGSLVNQTLFNVRKARPKTKHAIPFRDFQKYAAIIDIDGNSWSERFGKLLCMNSVVLKVHPEFVDYFYPTLQPWQHYIPVSTLEQLWNTTLWVLDPANKLLVRRIVSEAQDWCHHFMNYNHLIQHLLEILDWYVQELDKADPNWQNLWRSKFLNMNPAIHAWTKVSF